MDIHPMLPVVLLLGAIWGVGIAVSIEFTKLGKWLASEMMWFVVALGAGGVMLISLIVTDIGTFLVNWIHLALIFLAAAIPIATRRLLEHHREDEKEKEDREKLAEDRKKSLEEQAKSIKNGA